MSQYEDEFKRKIISAEEAAGLVKSGDLVAFSYGREATTLGYALVAKAGEVENVRVHVPTPSRDFGWYDPGFEDFFSIELCFVLPVARRMMAERRGDYLIRPIYWTMEPGLRPAPDVLFVEVSPPDAHGFCSFGASLWDKKEATQNAKLVVAEFNANLIRTYGDNFVHISEIDYFVEHMPTGQAPGTTDMLGRRDKGPGEIEKAIAENVATVIRDGDTLEIGIGGTAEWLPRLGTFDNKSDLGWHSENTVPGIIRLVMEGVFTGKYKTLHQGKVVATAVGGGTREEMEFVNMNPLFELYGSRYMLDPAIIAAHDNMVAINSCIAVDLTGQISAESVGPTMVSGTGGQLAFAIGANLSKGGRFITVLTSTSRDGTASRIVPQLEPGTIVTVPRTLTDIVVTEYGVARLKGKTQRERAEALIAIAHPDHRPELRKAARKLFWP
ncbi:MAG TPA: 4-hydroxybutyrate CoA transferase [Dehalococcoidia bacterium]|jgi:4-hydroxybutyrate CoA-transferase|nr:4-hydroxybutyrate CoA transferase [Dehalococcoidia bacterium]